MFPTKTALLFVGTASVGAIGLGVFGSAIGLSGRTVAAEPFQLAQTSCPRLTPGSTQTANTLSDPDWKLLAGKTPWIAYPTHSAAVSSIAFSPDGQFLASGSFDKTVKIWKNWNTKKWKALELSASVSGVKAVAFSPNGRLLADSAINGKIRLWDWGNERLLGNTFEFRSNHLAFSPDGSILTNAGNSGGREKRLIRRWDVRRSALEDSVPILSQEKLELTQIAFSPNGQVIAGAVVKFFPIPNHPLNADEGKREQSVRLWTASGKLLCSMGNHVDGVTAVAFSPNGKVLATAGADKTIQLWSTETFQLLHKLNKHEARVNSIAFSPSGKILLSGGADGLVKLWSVDTGEEVSNLQKNPSEILSVAFHPQGKAFAVSKRDGEIRVYQYLLK